VIAAIGRGPAFIDGRLIRRLRQVPQPRRKLWFFTLLAKLFKKE